MTRALIVLCASVLLLSASTFAHHSFSATYDLKKTSSVQGKVVQFVMRNPHSFLHVAVKTKDVESLTLKPKVRLGGSEGLQIKISDVKGDKTRKQLQLVRTEIFTGSSTISES